MHLRLRLINLLRLLACLCSDYRLRCKNMADITMGEAEDISDVQEPDSGSEEDNEQVLIPVWFEFRLSIE